MSEQSFDFDGGALCLDLANTAEWHASDEPHERLNDIPELIAWGVAAGVLDQEQRRAAGSWAAEAPGAAQAEFQLVLTLREVIYRLFAAQAKGEEVAAADLAALNEVLGQAMAQRTVQAAGDGGFAWAWEESAPGLSLIAWAAARSAADLLTSERLAQVKQCADDRGCGYLFVDTSRNRSRRWCSMASCGNRAKAKRHYERNRE